MSTFHLIFSLFFCASLITLSFCLSASEVAIFSLSQLQLRFLKDNFQSAYYRIQSLLKDPSGVLITILFTNESINVLLSIYVTEFIQHSHINWSFFSFTDMPIWALQATLGTLITAPIILVCCEITPKVIATKMNRLVAPLTVRFLYFFYTKLFCIRFLFRLFLKILRVEKSDPHFHGLKKDMVLTEEDLLSLAEKAEKEGTIGVDEVALIRKVFALDDIAVESVMHELTPEVSLIAYQTLQDAFLLIKVHKAARIPILSYNKTEVVGILYTKDLLNISVEESKKSVVHFVRKPFFVDVSMQLSTLFRHFKSRKTHIAVVLDHTGKLRGYVTMQDIVNCLFVNLFNDRDFLFLKKKKYG